MDESIEEIPMRFGKFDLECETVSLFNPCSSSIIPSFSYFNIACNGVDIGEIEGKKYDSRFDARLVKLRASEFLRRACFELRTKLESEKSKEKKREIREARKNFFRGVVSAETVANFLLDSSRSRREIRIYHVNLRKFFRRVHTM